MTSRIRLAAVAAGWAVALAGEAGANPVDLSVATINEAATEDTTTAGADAPPVVRIGPFGAAAPVDEGALRAVSGLADLRQYAMANNTSVVSGNSVIGHSTTGEITIDGQSFHNLHGLSILTANTGNNVSINAAMNVNVSFQH